MAEFAWAAAGDVGLGVLGAATKVASALGNAHLADANAKSAAIVRAANNQVKHSAAGLAATIKSINNERLVTAASEQRDALITNAARTQDAFTRRNFEASVRGAEAQGRMSAAAAASGLGGAGITALSQTTELQIARQQEAAESQQADQQFDAANAIGDVIPNAIRALNISPIQLGYDNNVSPQPAQPNIAGALIAGLLEKKSSLATVLGSLKDNPANPTADQPKASFGFEATTSPVSQGNVSGTDLAPLVGADYVDRSDRLAGVTLN